MIKTDTYLSDCKECKTKSGLEVVKFFDGWRRPTWYAVRCIVCGETGTSRTDKHKALESWVNMNHPKDLERCGLCRFFSIDTWYDSVGQCKKNAPSFKGGGSKDIFPAMMQEDYCGEFQKIPTANIIILEDGQE